MDPVDYTQDFSLDPAHVWLNVASEGPLPKKAAAALQEAVAWKSAVHLLTVSKFQTVPLELKKTIARLIRVDHGDVILGNSATYGLHLLANGLQFKAGDEVLLLQDDFPTDILPWLSLQSRGVVVRQLKAQHHVLSCRELEEAFCARTKLVCLPLVHSFTGFKQDIGAVSKLCRSRGILCVANLSQAAGAFEIDLRQWQVDAVVCAGYKWLLGPYGTGFCWIRQEVRRQLNYAQNYWISLMDESSLNAQGPLTLKDDRSARRYDVFGTANFFNFVPWHSSIEFLLSMGLQSVERHNRSLVDQLVDGLDLGLFDLVSPAARNERTNIVVFSCKDPSRNKGLFDLLSAQGFHLALWKNNLRASPHIYNTPQEIVNLLKALDACAAK
ncbi:MAG: aminotransferase class V-fold PLP-dependent enzyme [Candidatus Omnitrophica bacterium]|nr:aminotransferase class V-fold PLP-dependent enzyme [Candidatus Omnitrophota bacterium]